MVFEIKDDYQYNHDVKARNNNNNNNNDVIYY